VGVGEIIEAMTMEVIGEVEEEEEEVVGDAMMIGGHRHQEEGMAAMGGTIGDDGCGGEWYLGQAARWW